MKRGIIPLMLLVSMPYVLAQESIFGSAFSLIFGPVSSTGNDMVLKVGLWLALILVLFQGAQKIFQSKDAGGNEMPNKKLSIIFALIISTIAVRFMPSFISEGLGAMTWIAALILLPYTLVGFVTDNKWARAIATAVFVIITWALFSSYSSPFVFPYIRGNNFLSDLYYMVTPQAWMIPLIAIGTILILFFLFSAKGDGNGGGGGGSSGPGLFNKAVEGLGNVIAAPFKAIGHGISGLGKGLGAAAGGIGKGIGAGVGGAGKGLGNVAQGVGQLGGKAIGQGIPAAARGIGQGAGAVGRGGKNLWNWWKNRPKKAPKPAVPGQNVPSQGGPNAPQNIPQPVHTPRPTTPTRQNTASSTGPNAPNQTVPTLPSQGYPPDQQQLLKPKIFQRMANKFKKQPKISPVSPVSPEEETFQKIPAFQKPVLKRPEPGSATEEMAELGHYPAQVKANPMTMREIGKIKRKIVDHKAALGGIKRKSGGMPPSGSRDARLFEKHRKLVNVYSKMKRKAARR